MPYMRSVMNQERRLTELLTLAYEGDLTDSIDAEKLANRWSKLAKLSQDDQMNKIVKSRHKTQTKYVIFKLCRFSRLLYNS